MQRTMMLIAVGGLTALLGVDLLHASAPPPLRSHEAKVRTLLALSGWVDRTVESSARVWDAAETEGRVPPGFGLRFRLAADRERLLDLGVAHYAPLLDDGAVDTALVFFSGSAGKQVAGLEGGARGAIARPLRSWSRDAAMAVLGGLTAPAASAEAAAGPEAGANERHAVDRLRHLAAAQAEVREAGRIDADRDGVGEFATLSEIAGASPARAGLRGGGADFSALGLPVGPRVLPASMGAVDGEGIVRVRGYCFRVFLPGGAAAPGHVHETRGPGGLAFAGGAGVVGVDASESNWCAFAWPETLGLTGRRAFFVDQTGVLRACANTASRWEGARGPDPACIVDRSGEPWMPVE